MKKLFYRGEKSLRRSVIAEGLTRMCEEVIVARSKHEASSELERIRAQLVLASARSFRAFPRHVVVRPKDVKQVRRLQSSDVIRATFFIDQQGKLDAGILAEDAGVVAVAQSDGGESRAFSLKFVFMFAQLRDVLAAEDSTVVAEKHDDGRLFCPERAEHNLAAIAIGECDSRKRLA
jgi:hypothetical protein